MLRKLFILVQWVVVLALLGFAFYSAFGPKPEPDHAPETWHAWNGFMAISYAGIGPNGDDPRYPGPDRLEEHLAALREAGYQPVTPQDIVDFLEGRSPLPVKPVLIMFEGGRKDSFIRATPLLRKTRMIGTLFVPTHYLENGDRFHLRRAEISKATRLKEWHYGSMGHDAVTDIRVNEEGENGHFLTSRIWEDGQRETAEAYQQRVADDYKESARRLEKAIDRPVVAYLYPFADAGADSGSEALAAEVNRENVMKHFKIAFAREGDPFNGPASDPYNLTRLRVSGDWNGRELLDELEKSLPTEERVDSLADNSRWLIQDGVTISGSSMSIQAGGSAWIRGSDSWDDVVVEADMSFQPGGMAVIYARHAGPHSYVRATISEEGVRIQERLKARMQTLGWFPQEIGAAATHSVKFRIFGNRARVWLDGRPVGSPVPVARTTVRGRVGLEAIGDSVRVTGFAAELIPAVFAFADSYQAIPDRSKTEVAVVLTPWFVAGEDPVVTSDERTDLLAAAAAGVQMIPVIANADDVNRVTSKILAAQIVKALSDPVVRPLVARVALGGVNLSLAEDLRAHGLTVLHIVDLKEAGNLAEDVLETTDLILVNVPATIAKPTIDKLLYDFPATRLIVRKGSGVQLPRGVRIADRFTTSGGGGQ